MKRVREEKRREEKREIYLLNFSPCRLGWQLGGYNGGGDDVFLPLITMAIIGLLKLGYLNTNVVCFRWFWGPKIP